MVELIGNCIGDISIGFIVLVVVIFLYLISEALVPKCTEFDKDLEDFGFIGGGLAPEPSYVCRNKECSKYFK